MSLIEEIKEFLKEEDIINFFTIKGYRPSVENGCFRLINTKTNKIENTNVKKDPNNSNRIRFKSKTWAFSLNRNQEGNLYLDHLLIGDVEKEEFIFSMRHNITKDNSNEVIVKLIDSKNRRHIYQIKDKYIYIIRETTKPKEFEYNGDNKLIEKQTKENEKTIEKFCLFKDADGKSVFLNDSIEYQKECKKEFLILEDSYITITPFIAKIIPFLDTCIASLDEAVKLYEIKRRPEKEENDKETTTGKAKIYKIIENERFRNNK